MSQPFGHDVPKLSWLGGKTYPTHFASRKNRPGNKELHTEAIAEDKARDAANILANTPVDSEGTE